MVIPWVGFPMSNFIKRCEPTAKAKLRRVLDAGRPQPDAGHPPAVLRWPYIEGLRMDEAMHPLAILAVGLYGEVMPKQDGAPIRIDRALEIRIQERQVDRQNPVRRAPADQQLAGVGAQEYGFYSNVNPTVDHPRWSQATERRIGEFFRRKTLMFNGYGDQVASLYTGMDLKRNY